MNRRSFIKNLGSVLALAATPLSFAQASNARVIVVGGGIGGTRAAAYLKMSLPTVEVILFDPAYKLVTNNYHAIENKYKPVDYAVLNELGVSIIAEKVVHIDAQEKQVFVAGGNAYKGDVLVLSPGIDFKWNEIHGYKTGMENLITHAWQHSGSENSLWREIYEMKNGENVVITVPTAPYRFPQGPYLRATKIANYLKHHKPRSKVIILDSNNHFPSRYRFQEKWQSESTGGRVEWVSKSNGGEFKRIDIQKKEIYLAGESIKAGVLNIIPPQYAGQIARSSGLTGKYDWCHVNSHTLESEQYKNVFVIGDANNIDVFNKTAAATQKDVLKCVRGLRTLLS